QPGLSQFLTSTLTIVGILAVMVWISPLLAAVALVTVPLSIVVTLLVARRSQRSCAAQWQRTGALNGQVEQVHTGHALVQVFGRRRKAIEEFSQTNQALYEASFRAQFLSGIIMPAMAFLGNVNYVVIAAVGGYRVATGSITLGDVQAFIQYSRQFTMPITQLAGQLNLLQSGLASAERVFEFLGAEEETPDKVLDSPALVRDQVRDSPPPLGEGQGGGVALEHVSFRYEPEKPLIIDFNLEVRPGQTIA